MTEVKDAKTWADLGIMHVENSDEFPRRFEYSPYGELDFVDLPTPWNDLVVSDLGVTFHCVDGIYHLTSDSGDPADVEAWRVQKLMGR